MIARSRRLALLAVALASAWAAIAAAPAAASFGLSGFDVTYTEADGAAATQAGSHPFAMTTTLGLNYTGEGKEAFTDGRLRDAIFAQIPGLAGDATAYPTLRHRRLPHP